MANHSQQFGMAIGETARLAFPSTNARSIKIECKTNIFVDSQWRCVILSTRQIGQQRVLSGELIFHHMSAFPMDLTDRQDQILSLIRTDGKVDVDQLAGEFGVTLQTVRRDLGELCDRGLATRTHGGARRLVSTASASYQTRRQTNSLAKQAIATKAAALIPNHCSVILNIGTTTEQVARAMTAHEDLMVISNNINVIQIFAASKLRELVIVGGAVRASDGAIVGSDAVDFIERYKVDYAVIGTSAIDSDGSILDFDSREVAVARTILANARTKILVADTAKFSVSAPVRICDVADLDYVVCDAEPPAEFCAAAARGNTSIIHGGN